MCKRAWSAFLGVVILFAGLIGRLFVIVDSNPAAVASTQSAFTVVVASARGTIYDRHYQPLVNDSDEYRAAVSPRESVLSSVFSATTQEDFSILRNQLSKGNPTTVRLTKSIAVTEGLQLFRVPLRYGDRVLAPHVIGYLDGSGQQGVFGIEYGYNSLLSSYAGKATVSFSVDGSGRYLGGIQPRVENTITRSGGGLVLTLDKRFQKIVEDVGSAVMSKGAIIMMNANSGDIMTMASFPSYQPNSVGDSIENNNGALINRSLALYDCGSVFKMVTTAAALENDVAEDTAFICDGYIEVDGIRFHCHNRQGHGRLIMRDAFAQSCNVYYIQLARQIGAKALYTMAQRFGLQQTITLASSIEAEGSLLPSVDILSSSEAALANFSFGQGYLMSSPLHISRITATIVNDGNVPDVSLVAGEMDENAVYTPFVRKSSTRAISIKTARTMQQMLQYAVETGTGVNAGVDGIAVGGKTGTAETGQVSEDGNRVVQSWFSGSIYYNGERYVITVLCEDAGNSNVKSTVVFRDVVQQIIPFL